jgi:hypothetical protein
VLVDHAVAVVVALVAVLGPARVHLAVEVVAVGSAHEAVAARRSREPVAVLVVAEGPGIAVLVVPAIADLDPARMDGRVAVVAVVSAAARGAVTIAVGVATDRHAEVGVFVAFGVARAAGPAGDTSAPPCRGVAHLVAVAERAVVAVRVARAMIGRVGPRGPTVRAVPATVAALVRSRAACE